MLEYSTAATAIVGSARPSNRLVMIAKGAVKVAARHRLAVSVGTTASVAIAVAFALMFTVTSWDASGTLLYAPLTGPDSQGSLYVPPDLKTLVTLAKSPKTFETLRTEFKLAVPAAALEKSFKITVPSGTKTVDFELRWSGRDVSAGLVNRLMDLFRNQVAEVRKAKINGYVDDFKDHVEGCRARLQAANDALAEFNRRERVGDVNADMARLNGEIQDLETELSKSKRDEGNLLAQIEALEQHMAGLKDQDRAREEDSKQAEAAEETVADNRRRQERLRELITDERLKMEIGAKLIAARAEATRITHLADRGHATQESLDQARASILVLEAQIKETDTIRNWKNELERIDKVVVPKGKTKNQGSTAIEQIVFKKLELTLMLTASRRMSQQIKADLASRDLEVRRLMGLQRQQRSLTRIVEACDTERTAASSELTALKKLQAIKTFEFAIITPAAPGVAPASSNRKLLLFGISGAGFFLTLGMLALGDLVLWPKPDAAEQVSRLGLPILGHVPAVDAPLPWTDAQPRADGAIRLLALRIRQGVPNAGSVVLLSSLERDGGSAGLAAALGRCFARRDERVLILDLAGNPADQVFFANFHAPWSPRADTRTEAVGLHAYLVFECDDPTEFVFPTAVNGVDCMPAGELLYGMELLATQRMRELFETLRSRYSLILAIAPRADHQVDLEMLAAHASGIVFHVEQGQTFCAVQRESIRHLESLAAPILGAVIAESTTAELPKMPRKRMLALGGGRRHHDQVA